MVSLGLESLPVPIQRPGKPSVGAWLFENQPQPLYAEQAPGHASREEGTPEHIGVRQRGPSSTCGAVETPLK